MKLLTFLFCLFVSLPSLAIVGGHPVDYASYPSYVKVVHSKGQCGGTIISRRAILTAAHCVDTGMITKGGVFSLYAPDAGRINLGAIERIIVHPSYARAPVTVSDLAIVLLRSDIKFSSSIKKIELVGPQEKVSRDELLTVIGMGYMTDTGLRAFQLMAADLRLSPGPLDSHEWINLIGDQTAYQSTIRPYGAGVLLSFEDGAGPCNGDSGGALLASRNGVQYLVGVNSFVLGECGYLAGYSSVAHYHSWIKANSGL